MDKQYYIGADGYLHCHDGNQNYVVGQDMGGGIGGCIVGSAQVEELNRHAQVIQEDIPSAPIYTPPQLDLVQKAIADLSSEEQKRLYTWMHDALNCRMFKD